MKQFFSKCLDKPVRGGRAKDSACYAVYVKTYSETGESRGPALIHYTMGGRARQRSAKLAEAFNAALVGYLEDFGFPAADVPDAENDSKELSQ